MDAKRFDTVAKLFADRRLSRRQALARGGAGLAAGALAAAGFSTTASAQARPVARGDATDAEDDQQAPAKTPFLFVQTYQSGSIDPTAEVEERYTLTLEQGHGQTVYFSDRPDRVVGATPTDQFLQGLGFPDDNPPNAALVIETAPGETDVAVVELFNPVYDPTTRGVTYEVEVLANWQTSLEVGFTEAPTDLAALAPSFGAAHLFIDDCPNSPIYCAKDVDGWQTVGVIKANAEMCWNYSLCQPCEPYGHTYPDRCAAWDYWKQRCNDHFGARCGDGGCLPVWSWPFRPKCY